MDKKEAEDRIIKLREKIKELNYQYFVLETVNRTEAEKALQEVTGEHLKLSAEFCERAAEEDKAEKEFEDTIMDIFEDKVA
jgi:hypothetical protein